jgi:hypothetical protein
MFPMMNPMAVGAQYLALSYLSFNPLPPAHRAFAYGKQLGGRVGVVQVKRQRVVKPASATASFGFIARNP